MLNDSEITMVEGIYLVLSDGELTSEIALQIQKYVYKHNFEQHIYLQWLINRWTFKKRDKHHLPLRRLKLNEYVECEYIHQPIVKLRNKKKLYWKCKSCSNHQPAKHNFCSICGVTQHY